MSTTSSRTPGHARPGGFIHTFIRCLPYMFASACIGALIYNPSGYSLMDLMLWIFRDGGGHVDNLEWYFQPASIAILLVVMLIGVFVYFKWEIAKDEKGYLLVFTAMVALVNLLVIGLAKSLFGYTLFSWALIQWQAVPVLMAGLAFGATIPRTRRAYSGTITAGGGSLDANVEEECE